MKRITILCLILFLFSCEKDHSPTKPEFSSMGFIQIVVEEETNSKKSLPDSLSGTRKQAKPATINKLEVRVLKSDNSLVTSKTFTPSGGYFEGTIKVKAQDNLKVLCIGTDNGVVEYFAVDEDVDVKAGKTTTATIPSSQWYSSYIPVITDISPNSSTDGSYIVIWNAVHTATNYVLQEADNQSFSGGYTVYSGIETQKEFSDKTNGTYYYRIMVSNASNITSGWSSGVYVVVNLPLEEFAISGTITGADGVTITLSGDTSDSQVVNDGGSYSFTVTEGGNYTVTPSKSGYTFIPTNRTFNNVISDQTKNFTATQQTHTISGILLGADGVTVTLGGDASDSLVVNDGGSYSFTVAEGGNYSITPSKPDYTFNPANQIFNNVSADVTQNFTAVYSPNTHTISGTVSGADVVTITLSGDASGSLLVNEGYFYSFTVTEGGNYTVTPSRSGYTFTPESQTFNNVTTDVTQNFIASPIQPKQYTLTMAVNQSGWGTTNPSIGSHTYDENSVVNITATPAEGYQFINWTGSVSDVNNSSTTITMTGNKTVTANFEVIPPLEYTISGTVTGADGVTITLSGGDSGSQVVNDGGSYSFTVSEGENYVVTPSKEGYEFTPESQIFNNVTSNQTQNFTSSEITVPLKITMISIPGGTFQMGDVENVGLPEEKPVHTVTLSSFEMSIYEITNAQYTEYLNSALLSGDIEIISGAVYGKTGVWSGQRYFHSSYNHNDEYNQSWIYYSNSSFTLERGKENWPAVFVSWYGAKSFALYYGLDLPTEAEWEYACRGGKQYKYGTDDGTISTSKAHYYETGFEYIQHPFDVGSYPANPFGLYDMNGNVWEWCNDWYGSYTSESANNPTGPQTGSYRVERGGAWNSGAWGCRAAYRNNYSPDWGHDLLGFRVVSR